MQQNRALAKLRAGGVTAGPAMGIDSPDLAEQVAHMGFDFVNFDWQHGQWTELSLNNALARFLHTGTVPIVRVKGHEPGTINRVLDMGAMGVIIPMIETAEQAAAMASPAYFPPTGTRSGGGIRLGLIGGGTAQDYFARANDEVMVIVMVESEEAIANVESIMRVENVDVVLIGPGDLMINVRAHGHDEAHHEALVQQVAAASKRTGTAAGYVCQSYEQAQQRVAEGFRYLWFGNDSVFVSEGMKNLRQEIGTLD